MYIDNNTRVNPKIRGICPLKNLFTLTPSFYRLLQSSPIGHCWHTVPKGTTSNETVETRSYGKNFFNGQIPRIFGLTLV
jgi:hypothetical protein